MSPQRIQRKRTKGWRMPAGAVYVGRPSRWGNPFEAYKADCCGYWDVRDDNGVTYVIDHGRVHRDLNAFLADTSTWTTRDEMRHETVRLYIAEMTEWLGGGRMAWDPQMREAVQSLAGRDLACWCDLASPCHADVLLELANKDAS